jgi:hypothetical protein
MSFVTAIRIVESVGLVCRGLALVGAELSMSALSYNLTLVPQLAPKARNRISFQTSHHLIAFLGKIKKA